MVMRREKAEPVQGRARGGAAVASLLAGRRPPAMQRCQFPYTTSVARPGSARTPPLRRERALPTRAIRCLEPSPGRRPRRATPEAPAETRPPPLFRAGSPAGQLTGPCLAHLVSASL